MAMAATHDSFVEVKFQDSTRILTYAQLAKAPDSLLTRLFVTQAADGEALDRVVIPSEVTAPGVAAWRDGSQALFQACMHCYTSDQKEGALQDHSNVDIASLRRALDFFNIPSSLWPIDVRLAIRALKLKEDRQGLAKRLLYDCAQIIEAKHPDHSPDQYTLITHGNPLKGQFTFYWQITYSEDGGPLAVQQLKVQELRRHQLTDDCYGVHEHTTLSVELQQDLEEIGRQHHMQITFTGATSPSEWDGSPLPAYPVECRPVPVWGMTLAFA